MRAPSWMARTRIGPRPAQLETIEHEEQRVFLRSGAEGDPPFAALAGGQRDVECRRGRLRAEEAADEPGVAGEGEIVVVERDGDFAGVARPQVDGDVGRPLARLDVIRRGGENGGDSVGPAEHVQHLELDRTGEDRLAQRHRVGAAGARGCDSGRRHRLLGAARDGGHEGHQRDEEQDAQQMPERISHIAS